MGTPVSSAAFSSGCRGDSTLPSPAFYRAVYSQIEEVGWEHLMGAAGDLSCLTFRLSKVDEPFHENLGALLERELPGPPVSSKEDERVDCGICYAPNLPVGNVI
ncbi:WD-repeat region [Musa troglodytarum]|uniref:WD-repeat region n=1 Tax=Musa troglodytarum TaxID=320322 RepID=A0A9E7FUU6_9LILI|nr:WD-repeat region [Musa troglodytarum]